MKSYLHIKYYFARIHQTNLRVDMPNQKTSRNEILEVAIQLFKEHSYHQISMNDIANACGVSKGNLYHHFKTKNELGVEALKYLHEMVVEHVYSIAYLDDRSDREKMQLFVQKVDGYFLESKGGCLFANLSLELTGKHEASREIIRENLLAWVNALKHMLKDKYGDDKAEELGREYVALTEGAVMMMNLYGNSEDYLKVGHKLIALLEE